MALCICQDECAPRRVREGQLVRKGQRVRREDRAPLEIGDLQEGMGWQGYQ